MERRATILAPARERRLEVRHLFPGAQAVTYMNVSLRGLLSTVVRGALDQYLEQHLAGTVEKAEMFATIERTRQRFASLINADADEIAFTKNVSEGLNIVASAVDWKDGDNVVVCAGLEHPNNIYLWLNLRKRMGVEVRIVPHLAGRIPLDQMVAALDARTRLVTMPTVTFSPGFVTDVAEVCCECARRGIFSLVDAAQSVGVLHTDVRRMEVDGLAVATQKGLLGLYGMGFLYCRREWSERFVPGYLARFGVAAGNDEHETHADLRDFQFAAGARRFDLGNYNYLGAVASDTSMALLQEWGTENIEAHVRALSARLASGMLELDMPVCGGEPGRHLGHIVSVGQTGAGHSTTDDPVLNSLSAYLESHRVRLSIRRGALRFSLHAYNSDADVDRVLELTGEWKRGKDAI